MPKIGIHMLLLRFALLQLSIMRLVSESEANIPTEVKILLLTAVANLAAYFACHFRARRACYINKMFPILVRD